MGAAIAVVTFQDESARISFTSETAVTSDDIFSPCLFGHPVVFFNCPLKVDSSFAFGSAYLCVPIT